MVFIMAELNIRELVVDSLLQIEKEGTFLSSLSQAVLDKYDYIDNRDKAFYKRVLSGTVERKIRIDYILGLFSSTKVNKIKPFVRATLRMSIYQIMWMENVPDSAVCNEAVKLIKKRGFSGLSGFVNGVLRNIARNKNDIKYPDKNKDLIKYLSIFYSCPEWIVEKLIKEIGEETTTKFLEDTLKERPVSVRLRVEGEKKDKLLEDWKNDNVEIIAYKDLTNACMLKGVNGVGSLKGYYSGDFTVMDYGSMMVALAAGIGPGDIVMDLCAAPGGKSIHAADIINSYGSDAKGEVFSFDISEEKCDRIKENLSRLNISNVHVDVHDATILMEDRLNSADVVIVDAPCSGIGVMGHKNDIKYRILKEDIESLSALQKRIIDNAVKYVKVGGKLVFSTCTISKQENEDNRDYILEKYDFSPVKIFDDKDYLKLIPGRDTSDGFFVSVFMRTK